MDAMILASCVPEGFSGRLADLGSGAGAAGFAVLSRCPRAYVTLVEHSHFMLSFAKKTLSHPANSRFFSRVGLVEADVTLRGKARNQAGLADNSFDFVIMNPPFNDITGCITPDREKAKAHFMCSGLMDAWLRTATAIVRPGGGLGLIARPASLREILSAIEGRFGGIKIVYIYPRYSLAAIRIILFGIRASRADLKVMPPLVLHERKGSAFLPRADAINNGQLSLWDAY
jgi:tRNA1(Val) A37 N6-methylase TrmN6